MLARPQRLTRGSDYRYVVRRGRRCAAAHLVTHAAPHQGDGVRFGFIVGKNVGNAVVRNTVRRRLKAICHDLEDAVRPGTDVVIRALPASAAADFAALRHEVEKCFGRVAA